MTQARGIIPRHGETDVMRDPRSCGYFIALTLQPAIDRAGVVDWLKALTAAVDEFVAPVPDRHPDRRAGAVAAGLGASFFVRPDQTPRFAEPLQVPAAFGPEVPQPPLPGERMPGDVLLYAISPYESKANAFLSAVAGHPAVAAVRLLRGYQRTDHTEPFGYRDGLRNVAPAERTGVVYVDAERHLEEPEGAHDGSYMAYLRIVQSLGAFAALAAQEQDETIGRRRGGARLDIEAQGVDPRDEPADPPVAGRQNAHVAKVGPRGARDDTQIFRRGLPFVDTTPEGSLEVGLNFCSFQASPLQLDVVLNDWALNPAFTAQPGGGAPGIDALLDPARGLTSFRLGGLYFVPPADPERRHIGATLFEAPPQHRPPRTGRVVVLKKVTSATDPAARFERRGFVFRVVRPEDGQPVGADFTTDSTGRAVSGELPLGSYLLREIGAPAIPNLQPRGDEPLNLDRRNKVIRLENTVSQPGGYGV